MRKPNTLFLLASTAVLAIAIALAGCSSEDPAAPEANDTTPPSVVGVTATDVNKVVVDFSESIDKTSAETVANYNLVEAAAPSPYVAKAWEAPVQAAPGDPVNILSAVLEPGERRVTLTTEQLSLFTPYSLEVQNIKDMSGNGVTMVAAPVVDHIRSGKIFTVVGTGVAALGAENIDPTLSDLYLPQDITIGPDGLMYVTDWNNHRVRVVENGLIRTIIGTGVLGDADEGNALEISLNHPTNVSFGPDGNLYMAAWHNSKVMKYDMNTKYLSILCNWTGSRGWYGDDGQATLRDAILNLPTGTAWGPDDNLYIADMANSCVRMVDIDAGVITTVVAVRHKPGFEGDGGPAVDALIKGPAGQSADPASRIDFDSNGNLYLCDTSNHRVRKVVPDTSVPGQWNYKQGIINTIAGNGVRGYSGDGGDATAAQINWPADVAIDPISGNCYVADKNNHRIRVIDAQTGIITTAVGNGLPGFLAQEEGVRATEARLYEPWGICFDSEGNLYIADTKNQRIRVVYR